MVGFSISDLLNQRIFGIQIIALVNIIFAGILLLAFLKREEKKDLYQLSLYGALFIGIFQCFALIPGASRSGTAITAALLIGMNIKDATKFSFMLSIPTILGALVLLLIDIQKLDIAFNITYLIVGFLVSMILAFLTIKLFLNFVEKIGMMPFVIYRLLLGAILILIGLIYPYLHSLGLGLLPGDIVIKKENIVELKNFMKFFRKVTNL